MRVTIKNSEIITFKYSILRILRIQNKNIIFIF